MSKLYPRCTICDKYKAPIGRDIHPADWSNYCQRYEPRFDLGCKGYIEHPPPFTVFPTEFSMGRLHVDHNINAQMGGRDIDV